MTAPMAGMTLAWMAARARRDGGPERLVAVVGRHQGAGEGSEGHHDQAQRVRRHRGVEEPLRCRRRHQGDARGAAPVAMARRSGLEGQDRPTAVTAAPSTTIPPCVSVSHLMAPERAPDTVLTTSATAWTAARARRWRRRRRR